MSAIDRLRRRPANTPVSSAATAALAQQLQFELIPMKSVTAAIEALPTESHVSVTCSPVAGITETQRLTTLLVEAGHRVTPHFAARLVTGPGEAAELAAWCRSLQLDEVYVIAGDAPEAAGPYDGALGFLRDFLGADPGTQAIGIAGYPDGHAFIDRDIVDSVLHAKQALLDDHGVAGWVSTQMCFDAEAIADWIRAERAKGLHLPIRLGVPGAVDRTRLVKMGMRLGVGTSMRYLTKNASTISKLVAPGGYDPAELLDTLAPSADELGIEALHCFTFNAVSATVDWQQRVAAEPPNAS